MVFRRRKLTDRVQTVVNEVLHLLQKETRSGFQNQTLCVLQATRLEERVLMSASPISIVAESAVQMVEASVVVMDSGIATSTGSNIAFELSGVQEDNAITASDTEYSAIADAIAVRTTPALDEAVLETEVVSGPELIVIDYRVQDADTLLESLLQDGRDVRLLRLDEDCDGLSQITNKLEQIGNVSAIHLLTHGRDGEILLGSTCLNSTTLAQHAPELLAWQHSLTANADLMIYGCDVAESIEGRDFLDSLSTLTGADLAASTDATGDRLLGGNWGLEFQLGYVETHTLDSSRVSDQWHDLLGVITVSTTNDVLDGDTSSIAALIASKGLDGFISLREAIIATNNTAGADTIFLTAGTFTFSIEGVGEDSGFTGDLDIADSLTIMGAGPGLSTINAASLDRVFELHGAITTTIEDVTIRGGLGTSSDWGGGILTDNGSTLNMSRVVVTGNSTGSGAGIYNYGTLVATDTVISNNTGIDWGGGLFNDGGNVTLNRVTISSNTAAKDGGGIYSAGSGASMSLTNVTLSGNVATAVGGAIWTNHSVTATNVTIAFNDAATGEGIFLQGSGGDVVLRNSVLYNTAGVNANRALTSLGNNIDSDGTAGLAGPADQSGINPLLDATLQNNGGFVTTHRLLAGSLAIDTGSIVSAPTVDARGTARSGNIDIGAFEFVQVLTETGEQQVNVTTGQSQTTSAQTRGSTKTVSIMPNGNYAVVWSSNQTTGGDASGYGVLMRIYRAEGTPLTGELQVNQTGSGNQQWATVSTDDAGNGVVVWTSTGQDNGATNGVYARRFNAAGAFVGNEFRVNTTTTGAQENAVVDMSGSGTFVVAWSGKGTGDTAGIFYRRFDGSGTALDATEKLANETDKGTESAPAIAINDGGQFAVAWHVGSDLYIRNFASDGTATTGDIQVDNGLANAFGAAIGIDGTGRTAVVYRTDGLLGIGAGVWGRTFNADGTERNTWSSIASGSAETAPSIAMNDNGNFIVVYESAADGAGTGVYMRRYDANFNDLSTAIQVNITTTGNQQKASVAMLDANNFVVVWSGQGAVDTDGVFARQYHLAPPVLDLDADDSSGATGNNFNASFESGGGAVSVVGIDATLTDADTANLQSLKVTITNRQNGSNESLAAVTTGTSITANYAFGVLTLSGSDTVANYQQVLRTVTYNNSQNPATGTSRTLTFSANDGLANSNIGTTTLSLTITPVNDSVPVIATGQSYSVSESSTIGTAVGNLAATDGDPGTTFSNWTITGGNNAAVFAINSSTGALSIVNTAGLDYETTTAYSLTITVSDGVNTSLPQTVSIAVLPVNDNTPVISSNGGGATAAISIAENAMAVTTVTATDADLPSQTLTYSISGGADAPKFSINSTTGALTFLTAPDYDAPADSGANNVYDVIVRASDGASIDIQAIAVTVTPVNDNNPVIISNGGGAAATISVAENSPVVTTIIATDADLPSPTLTYSVIGGTDAAKFAINAATGTLAFVTAPNFEIPTDNGTNNVYNVTVRVSDGTRTDTQSISVIVTPVNDNTPEIISDGGASSAAITVTENVTTVTTVTATDADSPVQTLLYSIVGGADAASFTINSSTGVLNLITAPNFEAPTDSGTNNVYNVIIQVSDGTFTDTQAIVVSVTPVNESNPVITSNGGGAIAAITLSENGTAVTTVTATDADLPIPTLFYSISGGADAARFLVNSTTGELRFVSAPNFESPIDSNLDNIYNVTVRVSDGFRADTQAIIVTVRNVNEAPVITSNGSAAVANISIAENTTLVTTVISTDVDGAAPVYSIVSGADASLFAIDTLTGVLRFVNSQNFDIPNDANNDNIFVVGVQVNDGNGATDLQFVNVHLTNVNERPVGASITPISVLEDAPTGSISVAAAFSDPDRDALTFSITQVTQATPLFRSLTINNLTGIISYNLQANAFGSAVISVQVMDAGGLRAVQQLTFNVQSVNDVPQAVTFIGSTLTGEQLSISSPGLLQNPADVDGDTLLAVLIQGPTHGTLALQPNGAFIYTPHDGYLGDDTFLFAATDGVFNSPTQTARIAVLPPVVTVATGSGVSSGSLSVSSSSDSLSTSSGTGSGNSDPGAGSTGANSTTHTPGTSSGGSNVAATGDSSQITSTTQLTGIFTTQVVTSRDDEALIGLYTQKGADITELPLIRSTLTDSDTQPHNRDGFRRIEAVDKSAQVRELSYSNWDSRSELTPFELARQQNYRELGVRSDEQISDFEEKLSRNVSMEGRVVGSVGVVTTGFSVGYLIWAVRGGMLLSGVLSQIPAWTMLDPLMVIDGEGKDDDKESLQTIMDREQARLNKATPPPKT